MEFFSGTVWLAIVLTHPVPEGLVSVGVLASEGERERGKERERESER